MAERERYIGVDGRIDLIIESRTDLLIIEIKIDAGDQKNQLKRYQRYAKSTGKDYKIYYLTLLGDEASQVSVGDNRGEVEYTCLSFSSDIVSVK
ncbi:MAG: PD-(D/E)XK nuclease family protein [Niameybacter sp.]